MSISTVPGVRQEGISERASIAPGVTGYHLLSTAMHCEKNRAGAAFSFTSSLGGRGGSGSLNRRSGRGGLRGGGGGGCICYKREGKVWGEREGEEVIKER